MHFSISLPILSAIIALLAIALSVPIATVVIRKDNPRVTSSLGLAGLLIILVIWLNVKAILLAAIKNNLSIYITALLLLTLGLIFIRNFGDHKTWVRFYMFVFHVLFLSMVLSNFHLLSQMTGNQPAKAAFFTAISFLLLSLATRKSKAKWLRAISKISFVLFWIIFAFAMWQSGWFNLENIVNFLKKF